MTDITCVRISTLAKRWDCSTGTVRAMIVDGALPVIELRKSKKDLERKNLQRIPLAAVIAIEAQWDNQPDPASAGSPDATPGTSDTTAVVSLRAARIAQRLRRSSPPM